MSVFAAEAAMLPESLYGAAVDVPVLPGQRNALRSVPASGRSGDDSLEDPLRLGRKMRLRLLAAVQALLSDPSIAGLKDAPKLAAVVLYAKSRAPQGEKNDLQTSIWGSELGRWMGVKESTVHHKVLPVLRGSGALRTRVVRDAKGHPTGLDCLVMPLWNAHHGGERGTRWRWTRRSWRRCCASSRHCSGTAGRRRTGRRRRRGCWPAVRARERRPTGSGCC